MAEQQADQATTQGLIQQVIQALVGATDKQTSMLSELLQTMKGAVTLQAAETHVREDINGTEAMQHASAMIPLNAKFWFDIIAAQAAVSNAELTKNLAGWNEIVQRHARNTLTGDHKDTLSAGPLSTAK